MSWILYVFGSGLAFFLGTGLILAAVGAASFMRAAPIAGLGHITALTGVVLVLLSAVPLPYWLYGLAVGAVVAWMVVERRPACALSRKRAARFGVVGVLVTMIALEVPFLFVPRSDAAPRASLYVIGDSVSAGTGEGEEPWPEMLARTRPIEVVNLAQMGAMVASALRQAEQLPSDGGIVLLEIGGNDLLGPTTADQFEEGLSRLLERVCVPGRAVLMFELPLPPLRNEFGRIQRRLAKQYGVGLIPKRSLISVLTGEDATLDSIHLTARGHGRLAETVWGIVGGADGDRRSSGH